jgi:hypothetical protein
MSRFQLGPKRNGNTDLPAKADQFGVHRVWDSAAPQARGAELSASGLSTNFSQPPQLCRRGVAGDDLVIPDAWLASQ